MKERAEKLQRDRAEMKKKKAELAIERAELKEAKRQEQFKRRAETEARREQKKLDKEAMQLEKMKKKEEKVKKKALEDAQKKGLKWTWAEFQDLLTAAKYIYGNDAKRENSWIKMAASVLKQAHSQQKLLRRTSDNGAAKALKKTRTMWREVHALFLQRMTDDDASARCQNGLVA